MGYSSIENSMVVGAADIYEGNKMPELTAEEIEQAAASYAEDEWLACWNDSLYGIPEQSDEFALKVKNAWIGRDTMEIGRLFEIVLTERFEHDAGVRHYA
jgi:hypothetical protein